MTEQRGIHRILHSFLGNQEKQQIRLPAEEPEKPREDRPSGKYYLPPTDETPAQKPSKSQSACVEDDLHVYRNPTLDGKAELIYEVNLRV
jgi:hypothetical protein